MIKNNNNNNDNNNNNNNADDVNTKDDIADHLSVCMFI